MTRLVALYPRTWRDRYEDEFLALLADRPPDPMDRLDIVRGALEARMHGRRPAPAEPRVPGPRWTSRTSGWLTLAGGPVWLAAIVIAVNGPIVVDGGQTYRDGAAAWPFILLGTLLLGLGLSTAALGLPAGSTAARWAGLAGVIGLTLWGLAPWMVIYAVIASLGIAAVAIRARQVGAWRTAELALVVAGLGTGWGSVPFGAFGASFVVVTLVWLGFGLALVRAAPHRIWSSFGADAA